MADNAHVEDYSADARARRQAEWPASIPREAVYPLGQRPLTDHLRHWARGQPERLAIPFYGEQIRYAPPCPRAAADAYGKDL